MAKGPKKQETGVDMNLLNAINTGMVTHVSQTAKPLLDAGLIQVDFNNKDSAGNPLAQLTEAGKAMVNPNTTQTNGAAKLASPYAIISGAVPPVSKRGFAKGAGATKQYPFADLDVGKSFFVPVSEKHPDPVKTLGSTVSAQNHLYSEKTGETEQVQRAKRGPKNRAVLDGNGNKIMETVTRELRKPVRKFSIRPVVKGTQYGDWTPDADGALITRVL